MVNRKDTVCPRIAEEVSRINNSISVQSISSMLHTLFAALETAQTDQPASPAHNESPTSEFAVSSFLVWLQTKEDKGKFPN